MHGNTVELTHAQTGSNSGPEVRFGEVGAAEFRSRQIPETRFQTIFRSNGSDRLR